MEAFIQMTVVIAVFALGVSLGAILEAKLMRFRNTEKRIKELENTTQEIKIVMSEPPASTPSPKYTLVDYDLTLTDPDSTQEFNLNG